MKNLYYSDKVQLNYCTFGVGESIKPQYMKVPLKRVYCLSLYWGPKYGGTINVHKPIFRFGPLMLMRSDLQLWSLTEVLEGTGRLLELWVLLDEDDTAGFEYTASAYQ